LDTLSNIVPTVTSHIGDGECESVGIIDEEEDFKAPRCFQWVRGRTEKKYGTQNTEPQERLG
jgi:hypothetical protein